MQEFMGTGTQGDTEAALTGTQCDTQANSTDTIGDLLQAHSTGTQGDRQA